MDKFAKILMFLIVVIFFILFVSVFNEGAKGEELQVWVLCDPNSCVCIRAGPKKKQLEVGAAMCGATMWTNEKSRNGYLYVYGLMAESEDGWISKRYIVYDEPFEVNDIRHISSNGRVACRKWIDGKIKGWVRNGDEITVYWMSSEWAVTNKGYIQSQYIE